jgi:excisionase family DNA binding protein
MAGEHITVGEARERLGISKPKMAQLIRDGVLATVTSPLDRRVKLVRVADVEALGARWAKKGAA